ncbi:MAG: hypothetical protein WBA45_13090 [Microthrixaceae bacterium]
MDNGRVGARVEDPETASISTIPGGLSVVPGLTYQSDLWARGSGSIVVEVDWFDRDATLVSTSVRSAVALGSESRHVETVVDAPSGAVRASMRARFVGTAQGDVMWVDSAQFSRLSLWPEVGQLAGFQSDFDATNPYGWAGSALGVGVDVAVDPLTEDGYSLVVTAGAEGWGVHSESVGGRIPVTAGSPMTGVAQVNLGGSTVRAAVVSLEWLDVNGSVVSATTGVPVAGIGWVDVAVDALVPAGAADVRLHIDMTGTTEGEIHMVRYAQICRGVNPSA